MKFGFELEVRSNARTVLANLQSQGVTRHDHFHAYHCRCDLCAYEPSPGRLFLAQEDCTVDGEIISCVLEHGSLDHHRAVSAASRAMLLSAAGTEGSTGFHVHVSHEEFTTRRQRRILFRLMHRYGADLSEIAAGGHESVRSYNGNPSDWSWAGNTTDWASTRWIPNCGSWLVEKPATHEFRLWNSTRVAWRMNLAIGLSVAMTKAALDRADTTGPSDRRPIEAILAPYMDPATFAAVLRQRYTKGGVAA